MDRGHQYGLRSLLIRFRPPAFHRKLALFLLFLAGGFNGGCSNGSGPAPLSADGGMVVDGGAIADGGMVADGGAIADGGPAPFSHCAPARALPPWAMALPRGGFQANCSEVRLTAAPFQEGVLRLHYLPPGVSMQERSWAVLDGGSARGPSFLGSHDGRAELCTKHWVVRIAANTCRLEAFNTTGQLLLEDGPGGGWRRNQAAGGDGGLLPVVEVRRRSPPTEHFYGFGERTGRLDRRGSKMTFWNTDAYDPAHGGYAPDSDPLYQSIPFFIGLRGEAAYGLFTDNTHRLEMDMAASAPEAYTIRAFGGRIGQYLIAGPAMAEVLSRYSALTGRPPLPPRWSLGYHQCRWGYAPRSRLEEVGAQFRARNIPADGLWLDIQHMDGFRTFTWDPLGFPNPAEMISRLAGQGFKLTVIADPGIKIEPGWAVYDSGLAGDHFLKYADGRVFSGQVWPGPSVFPDFTSPATRLWWGDQIGALTALGVRGIWLDVNEPTTFPESGGGNTIPDEVQAFGDGLPTTMAEAHNVYALNEARATYEGMLRANPERRPFILSRAGYAGIQRYAAVWTGDGPSSWATLGQTLPMLLNLGLSGVPFTGSDVGGYSGGATAQLFGRWMALGAISPFFRGHVTNGVNDQEPWAFGSEVEDISRNLIGLRYRLLPYLYSLFHQATLTGAPILRPLVFDFQGDAAVRTLDDQAMLGPFLMFAPIVREGASERSVYFPAGRWYELHSGAVYDGPATISEGVTLAALPAYAREGAILPSAQLMQWSDQAPVDPLTLDLYPAPRESHFELYEDRGDGFAHSTGDCFSRIVYRLKGKAAGATLVAGPRQGSCPPTARKLLLRFHRVDREAVAVNFQGTPLPKKSGYQALLASEKGWWWDPRDLTLVVALRDQGDYTLELNYDPTLLSPRPAVQVMLQVTVPENTPRSQTIHVATSTSNWQHRPLEWVPGTDKAQGLISVSRGAWFEYKYTRGSWDTVEKWPGCIEAQNRYGFGAAHPMRQDQVHAWRDLCVP